MADRREHERTDTVLIYDVRGEGKGWLEKYVNIGVGGLKFKTDRRYSLGAHVNIDLNHYLWSSASSLRTTGKVVRARETHGIYETTYEVAIEFINLGENERKALSRIISKGGSGGLF